MNVFLNEHCKDAMNISEFVDSIQLGFNDLVNVGKVGYVEGISSIIINKLRSLFISVPCIAGMKKDIPCTLKKMANGKSSRRITTG